MKVGSFSRTKKFVPEALGNKELSEGEQFYFDIATMETADFFEANAVMLRAKARFEEAGEVPTVEIDDEKAEGGKRTIRKPSPEQALIQQDSARITVEGFGKIVTKYVKVHNLFDGDGNAITPDDLVKYPEFVDVIVETMNFILGLSQPTETDAKNS